MIIVITITVVIIIVIVITLEVIIQPLTIKCCQATTKRKSEVDFCNRSWTSFRRPNANPKTTTHLYSQSRVQL